MKRIMLQLLDGFISYAWWKELMKYFISIGDEFEIRCWKDECEEINKALSYGATFCKENSEVSLKGRINERLMEDLLCSPEPTDKDIYNKMTKYFTINVFNNKGSLCSAHYGTEMYIDEISEESFEFIKNLLLPFKDSFSIGFEDCD